MSFQGADISVQELKTRILKQRVFNNSFRHKDLSGFAVFDEQTGAEYLDGMRIRKDTRLVVKRINLRPSHCALSLSGPLRSACYTKHTDRREPRPTDDGAFARAMNHAHKIREESRVSVAANTATKAIPHELQCFLCPGGSCLLLDPVLLPCCGSNVSRKCLVRVLAEDDICPVCFHDGFRVEHLRECPVLALAASAFQHKTPLSASAQHTPCHTPYKAPDMEDDISHLPINFLRGDVDAEFKAFVDRKNLSRQNYAHVRSFHAPHNSSHL